MNENLISHDVKNAHIQLRISKTDKNKLVKFAADKGGLSHWLINTALKEASKNESKK